MQKYAEGFTDWKLIPLFISLEIMKIIFQQSDLDAKTPKVLQMEINRALNM